MMQPVEFGAPWGRLLRVASSLTVAMLVILTVAWVAFGPGATALGLFFMSLPVAIVVLAALCTVRGYVLTETAIIVRRMGWQTRLPIADLQSVAGDAEAMRGALRIFGNGGLFSFSGYFWSRRLGRFRALATDPSRAVVLRYPKRTVVLTPGDPQHFIMRARTLLSTREFPHQGRR